MNELLSKQTAEYSDHLSQVFFNFFLSSFHVYKYQVGMFFI